MAHAAVFAGQAADRPRERKRDAPFHAVRPLRGLHDARWHPAGACAAANGKISDGPAGRGGRRRENSGAVFLGAWKADFEREEPAPRVQILHSDRRRRV